MRVNSEYEIPYKGLKQGIHTFSYEISRKFFDLFEVESAVENAEIKCALTLDIKLHMLVLDFSLSGWVEVPCDRCLTLYKQPIESNQRLFVKIVDQLPEYEPNAADDVVFLLRSEGSYDFKHDLFDYILLSMPISLHCNRTTCAETMQKFNIKQNNTSDNDDDRWNELLKLKN